MDVEAANLNEDFLIFWKIDNCHGSIVKMFKVKKFSVRSWYIPCCHLLFPPISIVPCFVVGAHSLGRAHKELSGFHGLWDTSEFKFDNGYYLGMSRVQDWKPELVRQK